MACIESYGLDGFLVYEPTELDRFVFEAAVAFICVAGMIHAVGDENLIVIKSVSTTSEWK